MPSTYNILIMGASYGSLLASKLLFGGHAIKLVCLPAQVTAAGPGDVDPKDYDLVGLAMQEPQYRAPGVRQLLDAVARSRVPCMSIMNMPPLPYLKRVPGLNTDTLKAAYTDATVWDNFEPALITLCRPHPHAIP